MDHIILKRKRGGHLEVLYCDESLVVAVKPAGVLSTDEPGGMPELVRAFLGDDGAEVRTVHRLDRVVGGLMVLARSSETASRLSRQITDGAFQKEYLAVTHFCPHAQEGSFTDLLAREPGERKTYVVKKPGKDVRSATLNYSVLSSQAGLSLVRVKLVTGRTHQIRAQFSARGLPLVGDRKYGLSSDDCPIALWSCRLAFAHPLTGEKLEFTKRPPEIFPWTSFSEPLRALSAYETTHGPDN